MKKHLGQHSPHDEKTLHVCEGTNLCVGDKNMLQMDDGTPTMWVIGMPIIHECRIFDDENALYEGEENTFMWVMGTLSIWSS